VADQKDSLETDAARFGEEASDPLDSFDSSSAISPFDRAETYRPEETIAGFTSASLSRGRYPGYGLYFSKTRIIGVRKRRIFLVFVLALTVPLFAGLLYLNFALGFSDLLTLLSCFSSCR